MGAVGVAEIAAQRDAVVSLVRDFEPGLLSATDCALVRQHATAMKNAAADARVARRGACGRDPAGDRDRCADRGA